LAAVRTSPPVPSPTTPLPPSSSHNSIHSHSLLNVPSPPDTLLSLPARQTVIIQQATIAPSFSGKADEKPRPFLLQLHQYTNSSYGWDKEMLLQNIGQFLKGTAFECSIHNSFIPSSQLLQVNGTLEGYPTKFTIDTGSNLTVLSAEAFRKIEQKYCKLIPIKSPSLTVRCANGQSLRTHGLFQLNISFFNKTFLHPVYILPHLQHVCIIGLDFLRKHDIHVGGTHDQILFPKESQDTNSFASQSPSLDQCNTSSLTSSNSSSYSLAAIEAHSLLPYHSMIIPVNPTKPFSKFSPDETYSVSSLHENPRVANGLISPSKSLFIEISNFSHDSIEVHPQQKLAVMELLTEHQLNSLSRLSHTPHPIEEEQIYLPDLSYSDLNDIQKAKLVTLIQQYPQGFTEKLGRTHITKHVIELQPGTQPANIQPYRLPPSKKAIVDQQLEEMLQAGHITPSHSPWASPIVLSPKKDGTLRFCVDYRKLNANTIRTAYPMPQVDDTLDSLREAAFITHRGLYEFLVMPFGLSNAPATFQRLMDLILAG
ncbi:unnamed protein product, partial [Rotaria sp. Silwood2]